MDKITTAGKPVVPAPFNSPIEIGLRALMMLTEAFQVTYGLQTLVVYDYMLVHSDDIPGGPSGLHPKTPHRSGELLVRRAVLQQGLTLYESRGLLCRHYRHSGVAWGATERSAIFVDSLDTEYVVALGERAAWLIEEYGHSSSADLAALVSHNLGEWGAEFEMESILTGEEVE